MSELFHIVYVSFSHKSLTEKELEELLHEIRKKNQIHNVTGLLLYNNESFIQVVEGEKRTLKDLYEHIMKDHRHNNIVKLLEEPISQRVFPNWSMGFKIIDNKKINKIPGYSNFISDNNSDLLIKNGAPEIMKLLISFKLYT